MLDLTYTGQRSYAQKSKILRHLGQIGFGIAVVFLIKKKKIFLPQ